MTQKFVEKAQALGRQPTECNWFQFFAQETWDRIGFARTRKGLRIWETTITQNLIFEFHSAIEMYMPRTLNWGIDIKESRNERTNGNDIELFVEVNGSIVFFAVQAKIINHMGYKRVGLANGNYLYVGHQVGQNHQIDLLINYAKRKKGVPLYLFYNYINGSFPENQQCGINYGIEQYGCSIISADYIKQTFLNGNVWTTPEFNQIHPKPALPWFVIPCCFKTKTKKQLLEMLSIKDIQESDIEDYNLDDLRSDKDWKSLSPFEYNEASKESVEHSESDASLSSEMALDNVHSEVIEFNPKYRIILSPRLAKGQSSSR